MSARRGTPSGSALFIDDVTTRIDEYLTRVSGSSDVRVVYERIEEHGEPEPGPDIYSINLPRPLINVLERRGIKRLYKFQFEAYKKILNG